MTIVRPCLVAILVLSALAGPAPPDPASWRGASVQAAQPRGGARTRPPEWFACQPDALTSYTGVVVGYRRQAGRTSLRIRTDSDTTERVSIRHPGNDNPAPWFRFAGQPFEDSDWRRVESRPGHLRPGVRATAWVCADGRTMVDWEAAKE
jgi:hypothetical protein